ncbi:hypothetical protein E2C01_060064 [Portunus trituberculatus]|uniref:Uncharacterized protein n=1 Tax=Portunus trituberculatus TaxID=210409 RepID=A0A5B7H8A4_PORTR|nr:hypothetical protein [Portunus trituberculatus]
MASMLPRSPIEGQGTCLGFSGWVAVREEGGGAQRPLVRTTTQPRAPPSPLPPLSDNHCSFSQPRIRLDTETSEGQSSRGINQTSAASLEDSALPVRLKQSFHPDASVSPRHSFFTG